MHTFLSLPLVDAHKTLLNIQSGQKYDTSKYRWFIMSGPIQNQWQINHAVNLSRSLPLCQRPSILTGKKKLLSVWSDGRERSENGISVNYLRWHPFNNPPPPPSASVCVCVSGAWWRTAQAAARESQAADSGGSIWSKDGWTASLYWLHLYCL